MCVFKTYWSKQLNIVDKDFAHLPCQFERQSQSSDDDASDKLVEEGRNYGDGDKSVTEQRVVRVNTGAMYNNSACEGVSLEAVAFSLPVDPALAPHRPMTIQTQVLSSEHCPRIRQGRWLYKHPEAIGSHADEWSSSGDEKIDGDF